MKLILATLLISLLLIGCLKPVYFHIKLSNGANKIMSNCRSGKIVQTFYSFPYHSGSVFIYNDFFFDQSLILNLNESYVYYRGSKWKLNFIADDLKKDTIHIDGYSGTTTHFSLPPWYKFGDTIELHFNEFVKNTSGEDQEITPVILVLEKTERKK